MLILKLLNIIFIWNLRFYLPIINPFFINSLIRNYNSSNCISSLYNEIDNSISSFDFDKASCLSHQYNYVFNKISNINIPILSISSNISSSLSSYPTTPELLRKFLCLLPSKFNNSPDGIPKRLLKKLSFELCHPLSIIFTNILDSGIFLDIWKISHIIPYSKKVTLLNQQIIIIGPLAFYQERSFF